MLSNIEASADESEDPHLAAQPQKIAVGNGDASVASKAGVEQVEICGELVDQRIGSGFSIERRPQAAPDEGELAPVGLVLRSRGKRIRIGVQLTLIAPDRCRELLADLRQAGRLAEVNRQRADPLSVACQQRSALQPQ